MIKLNIGTLECATKQEIIFTLEEIIRCIENDYYSGLTSDGTSWNIEGKEEFDEDFD